MTKKERFQELLQQLENIGDEINMLLTEDREENEEIDSVMMDLRISIDMVSELEVEE
jgi:hypothetical protein